MRISNPIGKLGEDLAVDYLQQKGYKILERNFRKSYAEIDIICSFGNAQDKILVFVEVKTRTSNAFGTPFESITYFKLKPLLKTAQFYAMTHSHLPQSLRIDAIGITLSPGGEVKNIEHLENISGY